MSHLEEFDGNESQSGSFYKIVKAIKSNLKRHIQDATDSTVRIMSNPLGMGTHLPSDYRSFIKYPTSRVT